MTKKGKNWIIFFIIIAFAILAFLVDFPSTPLEGKVHAFISNKPYLSWLHYFDRFRLKLGLDLKGGSQLIYQADLSMIKQEDVKDAMEGVRDVIERRVNLFGVAEPNIQTLGQDRLIVELAGVTDIEAAIKMIGETPQLDFREENPEFVPPVEEINPEELEKLPPPFIPTKLTGRQLSGAQVQFDPTSGNPEVSLKFNDEGKKLFAEITERNLNKRVAIFLDNEPITIPVVQSVITDGRAVITGDFTLNEAKQLAQRLNAGALPVPVSLIQQQTIGPALGLSSLTKSVYAGLWSLILVAFFMILYYRLPGLFAVFALVIYAFFVFAIFKIFPGLVLTLAGTAGFILSVGMAVDANILIFARTKEALREGTPLPVAVNDGFKQAWNAIRDSNLSSLITCVILYVFGSSMVRGFAITLAIGITVSMLTAIIITRTFLNLAAKNGGEKKKFLWG